MPDLIQIRAAGRLLLDEISAAMSEAVRRSGPWIACRIGCTECCIGEFEITAQDALRLRDGLAALAQIDPARAQAIRARAETWDEHYCPALDPATGACDLYDSRPILCRTFGPATRTGDAVAACELCYTGATDEEIAASAVELPAMPPDDAPVPSVAAALRASKRPGPKRHRR